MYEIPAHHLAAERPAPIPFPVSAGVHGCITPESEQAEKTAEFGGEHASSTPMGEAA